MKNVKLNNMKNAVANHKKTAALYEAKIVAAGESIRKENEKLSEEIANLVLQV